MMTKVFLLLLTCAILLIGSAFARGGGGGGGGGKNLTGALIARNSQKTVLQVYLLKLLCNYFSGHGGGGFGGGGHGGGKIYCHLFVLTKI